MKRLTRRRWLAGLGAALWVPKTAQSQPDEAQSRKARSIAQLRREGVPFLDSLPVIKTVATSTRRTGEEVVQRCLALAVVAVKGETGDHALAQSLITQFRAKNYFSPREQAFVDAPNPTEQERVDHTWRYEGVEVLLWALGIYDQLARPDQICDVPRLAGVLRDLGPKGLRRRARLRPQDQILDAADLAYRYHWAVVNARVTQKPVPTDLVPGVTYERLYALNWLIGYNNAAWDDITTDT